MALRGVLLVLLAGGCMLPVPVPGFSETPMTPGQHEQAAARGYYPADLRLPGDREPRRAVIEQPVRVYIDADYRTLPRWRERVRDQVNAASQYTTAAFGVKLVAEIKPWERGAAASDELERAIGELERLDPASDDALVVGMVGHATVLTATHHKLGLAEAPGHHVVLRAMNDADELRAIENAFPLLSADERTRLYTARRHHRELVVFLHEWAHTMGAVHEDREDLIMDGGVRDASSTFSQPGARLIEIAVELLRKPDDAGRRKLEQERLAILGDAAWTEGDGLERGQLAAHYQGTPAAAAGATSAGAAPTVSADDERVYDAASDALTANRRGDALAALDGLARKLGADAADAPRWRTLAQAYLELGALARADQALARAGGGAALAAKILSARRTFALPPDGARFHIAAENEPEVVALFGRGYDLFMHDAYDDVVALAASALRRFPDAPPFLTLECAVDLHEDRAARAALRCGRALAGYPDGLYAHIFAGQAAAATRHPADAARHFARAIELAPDQRVAYQGLADVYRESGKTDELDALRRRYLELFNESL